MFRPLATRWGAVLPLAIIWLSCDAPRSRGAEPSPRAEQGAPPALANTPVAPSGAPIRYRVSFDEAHAHYVDVVAEVPTGGAPAVELMMAVWTPGSYLVREYSRHVEGLTAETLAGAPLAVDKTRKNRWRVATGGASSVRVRYRLYAAELSVRTNWVGSDLAVLNGAATFLTLAGDHERPHEVALSPREDWTDVITALPPHPDGAAHHFLAPDFDTLVDSPIALGRAVVERFSVDGVPHRVAFLGDTGVWDAERAASDVKRIVEAQRDFWRGLPYRSYVFIDLLFDDAGGGGLEHLESSLLLSSPWWGRTRKHYRIWLGLVSHELFHAWNVKRLRPVELGPFDYENEVYTESLWVAEGLTSYYGDLMVARAGLIDQKEYLEALSAQIRASESRPGRDVQPLSLSSFDAWIKYYRPDENSANSSVSYYAKGAAVGFLLDAAIRRATGGRRSLDDAMRLAYQRFSGARGYTPEGLRALLSEVAGQSLDDLWARAVDGTGSLDLTPALDYFGLRFKPADKKKEDDEPAGCLGLETKVEDGRLLVASVRRGGPAHTSGVQAGDELLAIDDRRVTAGELEDRLSRYRPGQRVELLVSRWGRLRRIPLSLGEEPRARFELEPDPGATAAQRAHLRAWIGSER